MRIEFSLYSPYEIREDDLSGTQPLPRWWFCPRKGGSLRERFRQALQQAGACVRHSRERLLSRAADLLMLILGQHDHKDAASAPPDHEHVGDGAITLDGALLDELRSLMEQKIIGQFLGRVPDVDGGTAIKLGCDIEIIAFGALSPEKFERRFRRLLEQWHARKSESGHKARRAGYQNTEPSAQRGLAHTSSLLAG